MHFSRIERTLDGGVSMYLGGNRRWVLLIHKLA